MKKPVDSVADNDCPAVPKSWASHRLTRRQMLGRRCRVIRRRTSGQKHSGRATSRGNRGKPSPALPHNFWRGRFACWHRGHFMPGLQTVRPVKVDDLGLDLVKVMGIIAHHDVRERRARGTREAQVAKARWGDGGPRESDLDEVPDPEGWYARRGRIGSFRLNNCPLTQSLSQESRIAPARSPRMKCR